MLTANSLPPPHSFFPALLLKGLSYQGAPLRTWNKGFSVNILLQVLTLKTHLGSPSHSFQGNQACRLIQVLKSENKASCLMQRLLNQGTLGTWFPTLGPQRFSISRNENACKLTARHAPCHYSANEAGQGNISVRVWPERNGKHVGSRSHFLFLLLK